MRSCVKLPILFYCTHSENVRILQVISTERMAVWPARLGDCMQKQCTPKCANLDYEMPWSSYVYKKLHVLMKADW